MTWLLPAVRLPEFVASRVHRMEDERKARTVRRRTPEQMARVRVTRMARYYRNVEKERERARARYWRNRDRYAAASRAREAAKRAKS